MSPTRQIRPDLTEAKLIGANLQGANLQGANLQGANLTEAIMDETVLSGANLTEAILIEAKLRRAYLMGTAFVSANLKGAMLTNSNLCRANLEYADISGAWLNQAILVEANLQNANLTNALLNESVINLANLYGAKLVRAFAPFAAFKGASLNRTNLSEADLSDTKLYRTMLVEANLKDADLSGATLIETDLRRAKLTGCKVYGTSAWGLKLQEAEQEDLVITPHGEPTVTVDNLEVAQFIYLLLNNEKIRNVIDTITSKVVLILGRFTPERKAIVDAIRNVLRKHKYSPVLFDFDKPASRDLTETITILAHMARFVIADITEPRSVPQELSHIVPNLPSVPVQPLLQAPATEYGMFEHFKRYRWVLPIYHYKDLEDLLKSLSEKVITPAEELRQELLKS